MIYLVTAFAVLVAAGGLCIFLNPGPKAEQSERTAWLKTIPIAHRGLHTNDSRVPENSLKAFAKAVENGYAIELDVQLTADGKVIVFHDYNLRRMTGLARDTADLTAGQIHPLRLLNSNHGIPLFKEVLSLVRGQVPLLIEVKNEGAVGKLEAALVEDLRGYEGEFAVQAFNPFVLRYLRKHAPGFVRGQLAGSFQGETLAFWKKFLLRHLLLNQISHPHFVAYETGKLPPWLARRMKQKGLYLLTWTVDKLEDFYEAAKVFDNIIFEGFRAPLANAATDAKGRSG